MVDQYQHGKRTPYCVLEVKMTKAVDEEDTAPQIRLKGTSAFFSLSCCSTNSERKYA